MNTSDLIQARHRQRHAVIYVRQSSLKQVLTNQESSRLQYALKQRALDLQWHEPNIQIIDRDLGHTAATTDGRAGFEELVSQIALGKVGMLIAYDATRLARNCSHWYQERERFLAARRQEVQRLRYQSRLTERQYQHTDPENRLVAG